MSRVALVRCTSYEPQEVLLAVEKAVELLGGVERFARPGEHVLLKPNLLYGRAPERAVTTHPSVLSAVIRILQGAGAIVSYGDSPGLGSPAAAASVAGLAEAAAALGVELADFETPETVSCSACRLVRQFTVARAALRADAIISLPKLKTHGLTRMTGALKNLYGCVPGLLKAEFHGRLPDVELFSRMLVDLHLLLRPRLHVMDAVVAMEGNGPGHGRPRPLNAILASEDPVALDATACRMIRLDPSAVPPIVRGEAEGIGSSRNVEIVGASLDTFVVEDFDVRRTPERGRRRTLRSALLLGFARRFLVARPVIRHSRCTRCGQCVDVCPVSPKAVDFSGDRSKPPSHHYERCIRCYCCQELCPAGAIEIYVPRLGRAVRRGASMPRGHGRRDAGG
ncbi:MAG: DUF362 domain-containing protein [Candidatus Bipolaricaulota bacterium]